MRKNIWGADPDKYRELSAQFESEEHAETCIAAFQRVIHAARVEFKIPDVVLQIGVTFKNSEGNTEYATSGCGWGDQRNQMGLAKAAYERELKHLLLVVSRMATDCDGGDYFITDPEIK